MNKNKWQRAIKEWGTAEFSRWLLPDGQFLNVQGNDDHRIVGLVCRNTWLEFVRDGACSLHLDPKDGYLWIRTNGLTSDQIRAFRNLFDEHELHVQILKIDFYDGLEFDGSEIIKGHNACRLYLTDPIAFNILKQEGNLLEF